MADDPGGNTGSDGSRRDILGHNGSGSNNASVTDCHSSSDDYSGAEPYIVTNADVPLPFRLFAERNTIDELVIGRSNEDSWCERDMIANFDSTACVARPKEAALTDVTEFS